MKKQKFLKKAHQVNKKLTTLQNEINTLLLEYEQGEPVACFGGVVDALNDLLNFDLIDTLENANEDENGYRIINL